jgi:hypothetical protein
MSGERPKARQSGNHECQSERPTTPAPARLEEEDIDGGFTGGVATPLVEDGLAFSSVVPRMRRTGAPETGEVDEALVLALVDGIASAHEIVNACLLPRERTVRMLRELDRRGVIYIDWRVE